MSWFEEYKSLHSAHKLKKVISKLPDTKKVALVTEKIHGCNFSVACLRNDNSCRIEFASRRRILSDKEVFHSHNVLFDEEKCSEMLNIFNSLEYSTIRFIGELYGSFFREIRYNDMEKLPVKFRVFHIEVDKHGETRALDWEETKAMADLFRLPLVPIIAENCTVSELREILATIESRKSDISEDGFEGVCVTIDGKIYKQHVEKFREDKILPTKNIDKKKRLNELLNSERLVATINNANSKFNFIKMSQFKEFKQFIIDDIAKTHDLAGITTGLNTKFLDTKIRELLQ